MRHQNPGPVTLSVWAFLLALSPGQAVRDLPSGDDIITRVNNIMSPINSKGLATQTLQTSSGDTRTFEFEMFSANRGEKTLIRYLKPARIRGQAFLMLNHSDDIWAFFPRTQRSANWRLMPKSGRCREAISLTKTSVRRSWIRQFEAKTLGEEDYEDQPCWKVELTGRPEENPSYERIVMWVRQTDYFPVYLKYFESGNTLEKSLIMEDIRVIESIPTAGRMVMKNHLDHTETIMSLSSVTYSWEPPPGFFSERNLKR